MIAARLAGALTALTALCTPAAAAPPDGAPAREQAEGLTTDTWRGPEQPLEVHWHILAVPEYLVELAFTPLGFVTSVVERYRLDRRIYDLLRNDEGTIQVVPTGKISGGDGIGVGGAIDIEDLIGRGEDIEVGGLVRLNSDWEASAEYEQSLATLEGREVHLGLEYELDQNEKFYGAGNDTTPADRRILRESIFQSMAGIDIFALGTPDYAGLFEVGYRRVRLTPGTDVDVDEIPLGGAGDTVEPPPDFGSTHDYLTAGFALQYDTRDQTASTSRGLLALVSARTTISPDETSLGAVTGSAEVHWYIPVLPRRRVVVLSGGVGASAPLGEDREIPFHELVVLDRKNHLRGYGNDRFRDRLGWWTSAEYRYPIYEYQDTGVGLTTSLFVDAGRVAGEVTEVWEGPIRWDVGAGVRAETEKFVILLLEVARSPEGIEVGLTVGKDF